MKKICIFFDFESHYGMPFKAEYDLVKTTYHLMQALKEHKFRATFNICGQLALDYPALIQEIVANGHEIGVHGFQHENMAFLSMAEINDIFEKAESAIKKVTGQKPIGFRAPYMMEPRPFRKDVYDLLEKRGYVWASNRHFTMSNRVVSQKLPALVRTALMPVINRRILLIDPLDTKKTDVLNQVSTLLMKRNIFLRGKIVEIADFSTMDCSALGLPNPNTASSPKKIEWMYSLIAQQLEESPELFVLNLHDWIIGTENRLLLFKRLLALFESVENKQVITARELTQSL